MSFIIEYNFMSLILCLWGKFNAFTKLLKIKLGRFRQKQHEKSLTNKGK